MAKVIRLFYGFQFFFSLLLWAPIFYEYQRRVGLSDTEIFGIQSFYYLAFCILEIPTGIVADRWGHRFCMRLGSLALVVSNLIPILAPNYSGFLWHFMLVAFSRSLISGASSAYLYDYLALNGNSSIYKQTEGSARAFSLIGKVICWSGIGILMNWHFTLPYSLTALSAGIAFVFAWKFPKLPERKQNDSPSSSDWMALFKVIPAHPLMLLLMLQGVAIFVLSRLCQFNLFQPILLEKAFDVSSFGIVMSVMTIFEAIGSYYPHILRKRISDLNAVFLITLLMAMSLSGIAISGKLGTWVGLCVFALGMGLSYPIQRQVLNDSIPDSRYRATLLSLESIIDRAVCAAVASVTGGFVQQGKTLFFLHLSVGATVLSVGLLYLLTKGATHRSLESSLKLG